MDIRAIVFDFDGTLTSKNNTNSWKCLWEHLGYSTAQFSHYANLYTFFSSRIIDYELWCDMTCEKFIDAGFDKSMLTSSHKIELLKDVDKTLGLLKENDIRLFITSGNIDDIIINALGPSANYFDKINANTMIFNENNKLVAIKQNCSDYEGKPDFIKSHIIDKYDYKPEEILFIGNGKNDEFVYKSGVKTLCINPENGVRKDDKNIWKNVINSTDTLSDIIPYVFNQKEMSL